MICTSSKFAGDQRISTLTARSQAPNRITVFNNGDGVPVEVHKEEGVYVPELIFGHLLTSSNYNDDEKKVRIVLAISCAVSGLSTEQLVKASLLGGGGGHERLMFTKLLAEPVNPPVKRLLCSRSLRRIRVTEG